MNQPTNFFTPAELNPHGYRLTPEVSANLDILHERLNELKAAYGIPMVLTSVLRSIDDQKRINPKAMQSKHLYGQAADILDKDGKLAEWLSKNVEVLKDIGLWCEDFGSTKGWVHIQIVAPKSGKRFFIP